MKSTVAIGLKAIGVSKYQRFKISSKPFSCWWIKEHKKGDLISSTLLCSSSSNQRIDYVYNAMEGEVVRYGTMLLSRKNDYWKMIFGLMCMAEDGLTPV